MKTIEQLELENRILKAAVKSAFNMKDSLKDDLKEKGGLVQIPFICGYVIDYLVYHPAYETISEIRYSFGVGEGVQIGLDDSDALYDKTETRIIELI